MLREVCPPHPPRFFLGCSMPSLRIATSHATAVPAPRARLAPPRGPDGFRRTPSARPANWKKFQARVTAINIKRKRKHRIRSPAVARGAPERPPDGPGEATSAVPVWIAFGATAVVLLVLRFAGGAIEDADAWAGVGGLGAGDLAGAALWALSLWFCSPAQLLLLFLGRIETDRPSDVVLRQLGLAARLDVEAIDYVAPLPLQALTLAAIAATGTGVSWAFQGLLGDPTWAISTGIGACFAAAVYEVGRPDRLLVEEAQALEGQWQDFARFADAYLVRSGRIHESEVSRAFRQRYALYRTEEGLSDARLRDMARNWGVERTKTGWYRNVSLRPSGELLPADEAPRAAEAPASAPGALE